MYESFDSLLSHFQMYCAYATINLATRYKDILLAHFLISAWKIDMTASDNCYLIYNGNYLTSLFDFQALVFVWVVLGTIIAPNLLSMVY